MSQYASPGGSTDGAASGRGRQLLLLGALAVLVAIVVVVYFLRSSGHSSTSTGASAPTIHRAVATSPSTQAHPNVSQTAVPAAYQAPVGHNPFAPLVVTPTPTPTPTPSPTRTPTPSPSVGAFPSFSPTGLPTAGSQLRLTLVSVDPKAVTASVTVTDKTGAQQVFSAKPGQVFDKYFKLVAILSSEGSGSPAIYGADFEYGDQFIQLAVGDAADVD